MGKGEVKIQNSKVKAKQVKSLRQKASENETMNKSRLHL